MRNKKPLTFSEILKGILGNRCPQCRRGHVFSGIYAIHVSCTDCGLVFEKEPGYFLGAVLAAYFMGAFSLVPTLVIGTFIFDAEPSAVVGLGIVQIVALHPILFRYSKLTWLFLETRMTSTLDQK